MSTDVENMMLATSQQFALALFSEMTATGEEISEAKQDIGFKRHNVVLDVADLSILSRRAVDAAFFLVAQEAKESTTYEVEMSYFKWLMRFNSDNSKHFRKVLREAQKASIEVSDTPPDREPNESDSWISVPLLGAVAIRRGRVMFEVAKPLQRHIQSPSTGHWLSLRVSTRFTVTYARVIYDQMQRFLATSAGDSGWVSFEEVRGWAGKSATSLEFKYFKRDYLNVAIEQINEISDIEVTWDQKALIPGSRKVSHLRFWATRKLDIEGSTHDLSNSKSRYEALRHEFGVSIEQIDEILTNPEWTDDRIEQAIAFTRRSLEQGKVTRNAAGFFMMALKKGLIISQADLLIAEQNAEREAKAEAQKISKSRSRDISRASAEQQAYEEARIGLEIYDQATPEIQETLLREFSVSIPGTMCMRRCKIDAMFLTKHHLQAHDHIRSTFGVFLYGKGRAAKQASTAQRER